MKKSQVLLIVHTNATFPRLLEVGRVLQESNKYEPVFFFARTYANIFTHLETLRAENISFLNPTGGLAADSNQPTWRQIVKQWLGYLPESIVRRVKHWWRGGLVTDNVLYQLWYHIRKLQSVTHLIRREKPSILMLGVDIASYDTSVYVKVAHREHIPVLIPSAKAGLGEEWTEAYMNMPTCSMQRWSNRFLGALYPHWVYEHKGRKLVMLPAGGQALVREWLGLAPPLPWVVNSGYADAIGVQNEAMRQRGISAGLPPEQLVMTGSIEHDRLAEVLKESTKRRADLYQRLGLPPGRPMILSALTPAYRGRQRPQQDFQNYEELVQFWVQSLTAIEGYNIVISLHPSVKYEDMAYIEQWGARIARGKTADLIPLCDIYVAQHSSTIMWAIACGKPVVNYDVGRYRTVQFREAQGVIMMEEKDEFLSTLRRLTRDPAFYTEVAARQSACADQWGQLDGQAGQRMLDLVDQMVAQYEMSHKAGS